MDFANCPVAIADLRGCVRVCPACVLTLADNSGGTAKPDKT